MGLLERIGKKLKILPATAPAPRPRAEGPRKPVPGLDDEPTSPRPPGQPVDAFIAETIAQHRVVLFMKGTADAPRCGFSANAASILRGTGRPFHTVDVLADEAIREGIKVYTSWPTIPQVFVGGEFIGGADILAELAASGELAKKLS